MSLFSSWREVLQPYFALEQVFSALTMCQHHLRYLLKIQLPAPPGSELIGQQWGLGTGVLNISLSPQWGRGSNVQLELARTATGFLIDSSSLLCWFFQPAVSPASHGQTPFWSLVDQNQTVFSLSHQSPSPKDCAGASNIPFFSASGNQTFLPGSHLPPTSHHQPQHQLKWQ